MTAKTSKLSPLKKITATVGFLGLLIGVIAGGFELYKDFTQSRALQKVIATHIYIGDRFNQQEKYERAILEYKKVLEMDKKHEQAHRRIIAVMRMQWQMADIATDMKTLPRIDDILARIYQLRAFHPQLANDLDLLLEEARVLKYGAYDHFSNRNTALSILDRANTLYPENPEILAEMGLIQSMNAPKGEEDGIDLLLKVVESHPNDFRYQFYLGRAYDHAEKKPETIRAYYTAAKLATSEDSYSRKIHTEALLNAGWTLLGIFNHTNSGALTPQLNMPFEERLQILEYCMSNSNIAFTLSGEKSYGHLAILYQAIGDYSKADSLMQEQIERFHIENYKMEWLSDEEILWLERYVRILKEGKLDSVRLNQAQIFLQSAKGELAERHTADK